MKKLFLIIINLLIVNELVNAQSVSLAPTIPASPTKGTVVYNNGTNQLQYGNGTAWIPITNAASGTGWAVNGTDIYNSNAGRILIGASSFSSSAKFNIVTPPSSFGILHSGTNNINIGSYVGGLGGFFGTTSSHPFTLMANFGSQLTILPNGNVGIESTNPVNKLQIGSMGSTGFATNDFAIGNGTNAIAIYQTNTATLIGASTDIVLRPRNNGDGLIGININNPVNRLQIGSMGGTGYAGNDLAIGNGTNVMAISQSNASTIINSTTNIALRPNNGNGFVGINTLTPRAPLDVATYTNVNSLSDFYTRINHFAYALNFTGFTKFDSPAGTYAPTVSIVAEGSIYAQYLDVYSDSRIKNIIAISNSAKDLETIKALQITDYTMKDKIQNGNKPYKKVIAQQVEKFYPQAVNKHTNVVPDIYSLAEKVVFDENKKELKCSLSKGYDIKVGEKIEFVHEKEGKIKAEVIEVSGNSFTVKDWQYPTDKIFVYGREVNDFRTVDYEAIAMLGISAIQQLAKENEALKSKFTDENDVLKKQIADLTSRFENLEAMITKETKIVEKLNN